MARLRLDLLERLGAHVDRQLAHVVGERLRGVEGEVDDDVGAQRLAQLDGRVDAALGRRIGHQRRVLHVLGPDAQHDHLVGVPLQIGTGGDDLRRDREPEAAELDVQLAIADR